MRLRQAGDADLDWLADLETTCFGVDAWTRAQLAEELAADRIMLAADDHAGWIDVAVAGDAADVLRIAVTPAQRRTGLATELLLAAIAAARQRGAHRLLLEVAEHNTGAIAFYTDVGFQHIHTREHYYVSGEAAWILELPIEHTTR
jgi:ribosomal-protein-alanine N-acetyltransferase